jgi:hypothetical protein
MTTATKLNVYADKYRTNYGKSPRGFGLWGFELIDASSNTVYKTILAPRSMTYTEARKWIVEHVRSEYAGESATGYLYIEVAR